MLGAKFYLGQSGDYITWEREFQIAPRNCSHGVGGMVSIYVILVKGEYVQSSTYFCRKFLLVMRDIIITMKDFSAFLDTR